MAAASNIVINDGQATPVAHTFNPVGVDMSKASYMDRVTGVTVGYPQIELTLRNPNPKSPIPVYIATVMVSRPTLAVTAPQSGSGVQPAPQRSHEQVAKVTFFLPQRGTPPERADILAYCRNLLANASISSLVVDLERPF